MREGHCPSHWVGALRCWRLYYTASSKVGRYGLVLILHQILMRLTDEKWLIWSTTDSRRSLPKEGRVAEWGAESEAGINGGKPHGAVSPAAIFISCVLSTRRTSCFCSAWDLWISPSWHMVLIMFILFLTFCWCSYQAWFTITKLLGF